MPIDLNSWPGYCEEKDLLVGVDIPLPAYVDKAQVVRDAADEIDSMIGFLYKTPIDISGSANVEKYRPTVLLLKRINRFLASGRLVLAAAASGEESQLHAYGADLVNQALTTLNMIVERRILLEGALPATVDNEANVQVSRGFIYNLDGESLVEHFYDNILNAAPRPRGANYLLTDHTGSDGS